MNDNIEAAEVLERAADRTQFKGWARGTSAVDANGEPTLIHNQDAVGWCATGAICREGTKSNVNTKAISALFDVLPSRGHHVGGPYLGVAHWNDNLAKDANEVADKMRLAAKNLRDEVDR